MCSGTVHSVIVKKKLLQIGSKLKLLNICVCTIVAVLKPLESLHRPGTVSTCKQSAGGGAQQFAIAYCELWVELLYLRIVILLLPSYILAAPLSVLKKHSLLEGRKLKGCKLCDDIFN
jgi:hypothetical protein